MKLSQVASGPVTYAVSTANGSALAGSDYVARNLPGETIPAGQASRSFAVSINGDVAKEASETFVVNLRAATGATILDSQARGAIVKRRLGGTVATVPATHRTPP